MVKAMGSPLFPGSPSLLSHPCSCSLCTRPQEPKLSILETLRSHRSPSVRRGRDCGKLYCPVAPALLKSLVGFYPNNVFLD